MAIPTIAIIAIFLISWLVFWLPFAILGVVKLHWRPFQPSTSAQKLPLLAALYLLAPLILSGVCWAEGSTFATYGMPFQSGLLSSMLTGLVIGTLGLIAVFWLQSSLGWLTWNIDERWNRTSSTAASQKIVTAPAQPALLSPTRQVLLLLILGVWVGWTEELVFRGFLQTQFAQALPVWSAATVASLIFALLHWVWEGKPVLPQLPGLWLMGMVLVLARGTDHGNLGLAWGLHAGWIWTIASLDHLALIRYTHNVPDWVTGQDAQPLAGAMGLIFLLLTAVGVWVAGSLAS